MWLSRPVTSGIPRSLSTKSNLSFTDPTKVVRSPSWRLAWTEVLKKLRKVEFGGEIGAILQQSRVLLDDLQHKV